MKVPFVDLKDQTESIKEEISKAVMGTISRCDFVLGAAVQEFEERFADFIGCRESVGVSSGYDALFLAVKALDIKEGDEVILPVNTFIATAYAVSASGAKPVFVDCDDTFNIDPFGIESRITDRTRAVIPVHLTGQSCDIERVVDIAKKHNLHVIEDAAQAHGAAFNGKTCGSFGDIGCFSFYPGKNLGAFGDGGAVTTDSPELAAKIKALRNCGQEPKNNHKYLGYNKRLDTIQASVLLVKLKYMDQWNGLRQRNAGLYDKLLDGISGVETPKVRPECSSVFHLYVIVCERRDELQRFLTERDVHTGIHYPLPIHLQPCYKDLGYIKGDFPFAEGLAGKILSLPMFPELQKEQIEHVAASVREFYSA